MLYRRLADVVLVIHALIVAFIFFGLTGAAVEPWIGLFHFPLALWGCTGGIMGWTCPLTPLENRLRRAAGEQGYEGSCVDHYIGRRFGLNPGGNDANVPNNKGRKAQIIIGVLIGVLSLAVYGASWSMYHDAIWPPSKPPAIQTTPNEPLNSDGWLGRSLRRTSSGVSRTRPQPPRRVSNSNPGFVTSPVVAVIA